MPSEIEKSWVAGIVDADGCVTMVPAGGGYNFRKPIVIVDNTDKEILDELTRIYGGHLVKKKKYKEHHRQAWSWRIYGASQTLAVLQEILPYMHCRIKRDRARMLLDSYKALTSRCGKYTPEQIQAKRDFEAAVLTIGAGRGSQNRPQS
jgi:hypothetical protein